MYAAHFGLTEVPFSITPDTSYFFSFASYQAALNTLLIAVNSGEGFIKITGEVGTGKTLLCRKFMSLLDTGFITAYIPNPMLEPRTLMLALADELAVPLDVHVDQHQLMKAINEHLLGLAAEGKKIILCIDEAQALPLETLESLRLLSNLETEKTKLLQIVLFGQPELDRKLGLRAVRQLAQRISFHYRLRGLVKNEVAVYLNHRLNIAGFKGSALFTSPAIAMIYLFSGGNPRLINILSHKAMMLTFGAGKQSVGAWQIWLAVLDTLAFKIVLAQASLVLVSGAGIVCAAALAWYFLK